MSRAAPRSWRGPVVQFVGVGLVTAAVLALVTGWLGERAARDEAVLDAETTTQLLARAVVQPGIPEGLLTNEPAAVDRFDRLIRTRVIGGEVLRVKIWDADGTVVYSDEPRLNRDQFALDAEELMVLREGGTEAEASDLSGAENRYDQRLGDVVEVYTQVWAPEREPLLFEVYFSAAGVTERADEVLGQFRPISVGGILLFLLLAVPLVWVLARRLDAAAREREALLQAAVDASDIERRRIARDLHDGVVQDLAGTAFALSASSRATETRPDLRERLEQLAVGVRQSLRTLRSLLVEIYPPDLHTAGLAAALDDLVAPATAAGIDVRIDLPDTTGATEEAVGLMWRTAQEAVRNAIRHGAPQVLTIRVRRHGDGPGWELEVTDDGRGFDVDRPVDEGHFGLRSLRDLVTMAGGRLAVWSAPDRGTRVTLQVAKP